MTKKTSPSVLLSVVFLVICLTGVSIGQNMRNRHMLKGLTVINVLVIGPLPEALRNATGISEQGLTTQIELRLRQSGLRVIEKTKDNIPPLFSVIINSTSPSSTDLSVYAVSIDIELSQAGRLLPKEAAPSSSEIAAYVGTWHSSHVYLYGIEAAQRRLKEDILEMVDTFINDYLAENPKR